MQAKTIEGALPEVCEGRGAGHWEIDGDSCKFIPEKMGTDDVHFDDAGILTQEDCPA